MRNLLLATTLLAASAVPSAAAILNIEVFDGATLVSSAVSASGSAVINTFDSNFSDINVAATGVPVVPRADLSTVSLNVKSATTGSHTLTIDVFQTGVSSPAGSHLESTFTTNDLIGDPGPTKESTFFNGTGSSLGTLLATHTFPVGETVGSFGPVITAIGTPLFADAHQYMVTFTAAGQSSNDTVQLSTAVPEPTTWVLIGLGFAFMTWTASRRPRQTEYRYG